MKILFIGVFANSDLVDRLNGLSKNEGNLSVAAIKYTRLIGEGLKYHIGKDSTNLFLVPIGMYPVCKILLWKTRRIEDDYYIPFVNVILLKQFTITLYLFYFCLKWYFKNFGKEKKVIVFSFLYLPFLMSVAPLKLLKNMHIASFVPDMPEFEFSYTKTKFSLKRILVPIYIYVTNRIVNFNDYFVYITKYMRNNFADKPSIIIEGFIDNLKGSQRVVCNSNKNAIMYSGALFEKFGIKMLLEAFHEIEGDYELWLFGSGDMESEIVSFVNKDTRIKYFGSISNSLILDFQKKAKLLVNPRFSKNEFTKFSFPSKLMEYMMSGTPVLTTRLLGIPNDYYDKMYFLDDESVLGFKLSILDCLKKDQYELNRFGNKTKDYVFDEKNNIKQIEKFINLINT